MSPEEKDKFKSLIHDEIEKTKKEMVFLVDMTKPISPENSIGRISRMDAINNKSVNEAALRDKKNKLSLLESALEKIGKKDFGICIQCRRSIPMGRLLIMPHATKCVKCS